MLGEEPSFNNSTVVLAGAHDPLVLDELGRKTARPFDLACQAGSSATEGATRKEIRCVPLSGRKTLTPEIAVVVQGRTVWVPVGTTLGDVISTTTTVDDDLCDHVTMFRLDGRIPKPVVFLPINDWTALPLLKGDSVQW